MKLDYSVSYMTEELVEFIDGHMLGDGWIEKPQSPWATRLGIRQKHQDFAKYLSIPFQKYGLFIKKKEPFDKRTEKIYINYWGRTFTHPDFLKQYRRWYPEGIKNIPEDCCFTKKSILLWYLGDGNIDISGRGRPRITLATNCFQEKYLRERIIPILNSTIHQDGFRLTKQNVIRGTKEGSMAFLRFVGESPVASLAYKCRSKLELVNIQKQYSERYIKDAYRKYDYNRIQQLLSIGMKITEVTKIIGCCKNTVRYAMPKIEAHDD